ncbi:hypothetical protein KIPB_001262 [Kipferlia bialata]|uniref:Carrier domain-containing protein n=1 Tax=Kipferlia bialata TaxID=797122 RepID=A0A9K3GFG2_9EUKA|nr:hypothetical protein KIPB_001262 [Kipferlia bialata]|eukprot:g1262.t1
MPSANGGLAPYMVDNGRVNYQPLETWPSGAGQSHVKGAEKPEWNIPSPVFGRRFARAQSADPSAINTIFPDEGIELTCGEMQRLAEGIGRGLYAAGVAPGQAVAVALPNGCIAATSETAVLACGFILIFISPHYGHELGHCLSSTDAAAIIILREFTGRDNIALLQSLPEAQNVLKVIVGSATATDASNEGGLPPTFVSFHGLRAQGIALNEEEGLGPVAEARANQKPTDTLVYSFTSGSTGAPKVVELTHATCAQGPLSVKASNKPIKPQGRGTSIVTSPLYFTGTSMGSYFWFQCSARTQLLMGLPFNPAKTLRAINKYGVHAVTGIPSLVYAMLASPALAEEKAKGLHIESFVMGGAPVGVELCQAILAEFPNAMIGGAFGMTETSGGAPVCASWFSSPEDTYGNAGRVLPQWEMAVLDSDDKVLPCGENGELCFKGPGVFKCYYKQPEMTAEALRNGWLHTGDMASISDKGIMRVTGRIRNLVIRGGVNIFPPEIEDYMDRHPAILEANVIGVPDKALGEALCAFYTCKEGMAVDDAALRAFLQAESLAEYKIPRDLFCIPEMPRTTSGKISKPALRLMAPDLIAAKRVHTPATNPPTHPAAVACAEAFAKVLDIPVVCINRDDSFFAVGGDSLRVAQLMVTLQNDARVGKDLAKRAFAFNKFFAHPTCALFEEEAKAMAAEASAGPNSGAATLPMDWQVAAQHPPALSSALDALPAAPEGEVRNVFVTGATGFIGSHIVRDMLTRVTGTIHCLVRAATPEKGMARLLSTAEGIEQPFTEAEASRLRAVVGDLDKEYFGMDQAAFQALGAEVDAVVHCGARVYWLAAWEDLAPANIRGTLTAVHLAAIRNVPMTFVSTIGVSTSHRSIRDRVQADGVKKVSWDPIDAPATNMGYAVSKPLLGVGEGSVSVTPADLPFGDAPTVTVSGSKFCVLPPRLLMDEASLPPSATQGVLTAQEMLQEVLPPPSGAESLYLAVDALVAQDMLDAQAIFPNTPVPEAQAPGKKGKAKPDPKGTTAHKGKGVTFPVSTTGINVMLPPMLPCIPGKGERETDQAEGAEGEREAHPGVCHVVVPPTQAEGRVLTSHPIDKATPVWCSALQTAMHALYGEDLSPEMCMASLLKASGHFDCLVSLPPTLSSVQGVLSSDTPLGLAVTADRAAELGMPVGVGYGILGLHTGPRLGRAEDEDECDTVYIRLRASCTALQPSIFLPSLPVPLNSDANTWTASLEEALDETAYQRERNTELRVQRERGEESDDGSAYSYPCDFYLPVDAFECVMDRVLCTIGGRETAKCAVVQCVPKGVCESEGVEGAGLASHVYMHISNSPVHLEFRHPPALKGAAAEEDVPPLASALEGEGETLTLVTLPNGSRVKVTRGVQSVTIPAGNQGVLCIETSWVSGVMVRASSAGGVHVYGQGASNVVDIPAEKSLPLHPSETGMLCAARVTVSKSPSSLAFSCLDALSVSGATLSVYLYAKTAEGRYTPAYPSPGPFALPLPVPLPSCEEETEILAVLVGASPYCVPKSAYRVHLIGEGVSSGQGVDMAICGTAAGLDVALTQTSPTLSLSVTLPPDSEGLVFMGTSESEGVSPSPILDVSVCVLPDLSVSEDEGEMEPGMEGKGQMDQACRMLRHPEVYSLRTGLGSVPPIPLTSGGAPTSYILRVGHAPAEGGSDPRCYVPVSLPPLRLSLLSSKPGIAVAVTKPLDSAAEAVLGALTRVAQAQAEREAEEQAKREDGEEERENGRTVDNMLAVLNREDALSPVACLLSLPQPGEAPASATGTASKGKGKSTARGGASARGKPADHGAMSPFGTDIIGRESIVSAAVGSIDVSLLHQHMPYDSAPQLVLLDEEDQDEERLAVEAGLPETCVSLPETEPEDMAGGPREAEERRREVFVSAGVEAETTAAKVAGLYSSRLQRLLRPKTE